MWQGIAARQHSPFCSVGQRVQLARRNSDGRALTNLPADPHDQASALLCTPANRASAASGGVGWGADNPLAPASLHSLDTEQAQRSFYITHSLGLDSVSSPQRRTSLVEPQHARGLVQSSPALSLPPWDPLAAPPATTTHGPSTPSDLPHTGSFPGAFPSSFYPVPVDNHPGLSCCPHPQQTSCSGDPQNRARLPTFHNEPPPRLPPAAAPASSPPAANNAPVETPDPGLTRETQYYKTSLCAHYKQGECRKGSACTYAHGRHELRTLKTALCKDFESTGQCSRGDSCTYAHGVAELRARTALTSAVARNINMDRTQTNSLMGRVQRIFPGQRIRIKERLEQVLWSLSLIVADFRQSSARVSFCVTVLRLAVREALEERGDDAAQILTDQVLLMVAFQYVKVFFTDLRNGRIALATPLDESRRVRDSSRARHPAKALHALLDAGRITQFEARFQRDQVDIEAFLAMDTSDWEMVLRDPNPAPLAWRGDVRARA